MESERFKVVVVGDGTVGKTCLLITLYTNEFPKIYIPTVFDNAVYDITVDDREYELALFDTAGGEDYWRLRPLCYPETDVFLLCFDICNRDSFENIEEYWLPELTRYVPGIPIILVGNKSDLRAEKKTDVYERLYTARFWRELVTTDEAESLARKHSLQYVECSSLLQIGVQDVFATAVRAARALRQRSKEERRRHQRLLKQGYELYLKSPPVVNPVLLKKNPDPVPRVEVITSTYSEDWARLLQLESSCHDVRFIFTDNHQPLLSHRIILSAASPIFYKIFTHDTKFSSVPQEYTDLFEQIIWVSDRTCSDLGNSNQISLSDSQDSSEMIEIILCKSISYNVFEKILQFLYTGLPGPLGFNEQNFLLEVKNVAEKFQLLWLVKICENIVQEEDELLNPSIGLKVNDETGTKLKEGFLNKQVLSDVRFLVEGHVIYAHKAVLMARCDVMTSMFGGAFKESRSTSEIPIHDVGLKPFLALLEYLYTDHVTFEKSDPEEVLVVADKFCILRLMTLCEVALVRKVEDEEQSNSDVTKKVIHLLLTSQTYNASQLSHWCLHYIATHFTEFESSEDFSLLEGENKKYVTEHRWPSVRHMERLEKYEQWKNTSIQKTVPKKCVLM